MAVGVVAAPRPAPTSAKHIASDPYIHVLSEWVVTGETTELRVYLEPTTGALRNLTLQLETPPALKLTMQAPPPATISGLRAMLPMVSPGGAGMVSASMVCTKPLDGREVILLGQLAYAEVASVTEPRMLSFRVLVSVAAFLRPRPISTPEFGSMWPAQIAEGKTVIACPSAADTAAFVSTITGALRIAEVQTIGTEVIACGQLVGSGDLLLLHGKLGLMNGRALELTVRSKDPRLTDAVMKTLGP